MRVYSIENLKGCKEEWYILPGGGQEGEEMLPQTVEREVREEAGDPECLE